MRSIFNRDLSSLPNLPCAIHVSDSEVYPVELLRRSTRRDSTGAYFTGVELSFGCYSMLAKLNMLRTSPKFRFDKRPALKIELNEAQGYLTQT